MACALPVVTSTKSGAAELVVPHGAGFVCPSGDPVALAAEMRKLLDAGLRERLGARARETVLPLTPEAMTLALVLLYKELLEASAKRQQSDSERKLAAHRQAWSRQAGAVPIAGPPAEPAPVERASPATLQPLPDAAAATTELRAPPPAATPAEPDAASPVVRPRRRPGPKPPGVSRVLPGPPTRPPPARR